MLAVLQAILTIAYPLLVWLALGRLSPRAVGLILVGLVLLRLLFLRLGRRRARSDERTGAREGDRPGSLRRSGWRGAAGLLLPIGLVGLVAAGTAVWNDPIGLLATPVLINAALFVSFAGSLRGPSLVEQLARLQVDGLSRAEIRYCRQVTLVWCGFFVVNGAVAGALALRRELAAWALYTGFVSYLLMGTLFAAEYVHRHARFRRYVGSFTDPLLSRVFPARFEPEWRDDEAEPCAAAPVAVGADDRTGLGPASAWRVALDVPMGLACWPGHFPGEPMVPGVVLVDWALTAIERARGRRLRPDAIEGLKFRQPVRPGDRLVLELAAEGAATDFASRAESSARGDDDERIDFRFRREGETVAEGRFRRTRPATSAPTAPTVPPQAAAPRATDAWPEPASILCHAPPMVWLAAVEGHDADATACRAAVADLGAFRDDDGGVGAHVALEWMAQCIAAHAGLDRRARGEVPRLGLLLGAKRVRFARAAYTAGESFRVVAARSWVGERGAAAFECRVEALATSECVAEARLSCFMPGDLPGEEVDPDAPAVRRALATRDGEIDGPMNAGSQARSSLPERAR